MPEQDRRPGAPDAPSLEVMFAKAAGNLSRFEHKCGCKLFVIFCDEEDGTASIECAACEADVTCALFG